MKTLLRAVARYFLKRSKWSFGPKPRALKTVLAVYPHTSNWDFIYGICVGLLWDIPFHFVIKESLFFFPLGPLLRYLGGIPIKRNSGKSHSPTLVKLLDEKKDFSLVIAPEGSRSYKEYLHSGFYHIAKAANVPVTLAYIDYQTKSIGISDPISLDGSLTHFMDKLRSFYKGKKGLYEKTQNPVFLRDEEKEQESPAPTRPRVRA